MWVHSDKICRLEGFDISTPINIIEKFMLSIMVILNSFITRIGKKC